MTMLYPNLFYNEGCYIGTALYLSRSVEIAKGVCALRG